ncbi:MAG: hypothetical protein CBC91_00635 [Rickettsiales bacterium TMED131]|nr:MAG: hypothetical protein CBC91_00635 [Rickettsiales bacterium TMED131]
MTFKNKFNKLTKNPEEYIAKRLSKMHISCYRIIFFDSILWTLFILFYVGHFIYTKQFTNFEDKHEVYEEILNYKDTIIFVVICLAIILYLHFFFLYKN